MLVIGLIIGFVLAIIGVSSSKRLYDDCEISLMVYIGGSIFALSFLVILSGLSYIAEEKTINGRIELYERENAQIKIEINDAIDEYVQLERGGAKKTSSTSLTTLVALYPEVCDNELVQNEIESYIKNNDEIKELENKLLETHTWKWWIYFG